MLATPYILFLLLTFSCKGYNQFYQDINAGSLLTEVNSRGHLEKKEIMENYDDHNSNAKLYNHQKEQNSSPFQPVMNKPHPLLNIDKDTYVENYPQSVNHQLASQYQKDQVELMQGRLLTSCLTRYYWSTWNWGTLSTYTDTSLLQATQSSPSCVPCPVGCKTCQKLSNPGSCINVDCLTCQNSFTMAIYVKVGCPGRRYCRCINTNQYPQFDQTNCRSCSALISKCVTCAPSQWAATYCAQCQPGYYLQPGNLPRTCIQCPLGCNICSNATICTRCSGSLIMVGGFCQCDSSQNLFYDDSSGTCTLCSIAVAECTSCVGTGLLTTCLACNNGFYPDGSACVPCNAYCLSCTNTTCLLCVSSTFTISGMDCICDNTLQLYLDNITSTCVACSALISNCQTCDNSTFTLTCVQCLIGYYDGVGCQPCQPLCLNCTSAVNCFSCQVTFITDNTSCFCDTANNYILDNVTNSCVLCQYLIVGCLSCVESPSLYCQSCSDPYYSAVVNDTTCTLCPLQCLSCTDALICTSCTAGYTLQGNGTCTCDNCGVCSLLYPNCSVCDNSTCLICMPTFLHRMAMLQCQPCPAGCATCANDGSCSVCIPPFIYTGSGCECNTALGYYYDLQTRNCDFCGNVYDNCTSCIGSGYSSTCVLCLTGFYLDVNDTCTSCPNYTISCFSASISTACAPTFSLVNNLCECDSNYQYYLDLNTGNCSLCSTIVPQCSICSYTNLTASGIQCISCQTGYYVDNYSCTSCPSSCYSCTSNISCTNCNSNYALINNSCLCNANSQMYESGGFCSSCSSIIAFCIDCSGSGPSSVICQACSAGSYLHTSNTLCILCGANCDSCDNTGCLTCSAGFTPSAGTCIYADTCGSFTEMDVNCVDCMNVFTPVAEDLCLACQEGYYLFGDSDCLACPSFCQKCQSYFNCTICQPTFTLEVGICQCDTLKNDVQLNGSCRVCSSLFVGCQTCNTTTCFTCSTGYVYNSGLCTLCPTGCLNCLTYGRCLTCQTGYTHDAVLLICNNPMGCTSTQYFDLMGGACSNCPITCLSCIDGITCLSCQATYSLINGACVCDSGQGLFASFQNSICNQCGSYNSSLYGVYTQNCKTCYEGISTLTSGFQCQICNDDYYLVNGRCYACQFGCQKCTSTVSCYLCQSPQYAYSLGSCVCDNSNNYFWNGSNCQVCSIANCSICSTLSTCLYCQTGYYLSAPSACFQQICGNGIVEGSEECDDGNIINGDGCSNICEVERQWTCNSAVAGGVSSCLYDSTGFGLVLEEQLYSCNQVDFVFKLTGSQDISSCDLSSFLVISNVSASLKVYKLQGQILTYTYILDKTIQNDTAKFYFDPATLLCLSNAYNYFPVAINTEINPTNNQLAMYYQGSNCSKVQALEHLTDAVQYTSYGVLFLSMLPCKIVGLELFGVLQLAFISLGSLDNINLLQSPLKKLKSTNGLNLDIGQDEKSKRLLQTFYTTERIDAIDYRANFLRNCNLMFAVLVVVIVVGFIFYLLTFCCQNWGPCLYQIGQRIVKEVLLTLILFNMFNFAYAAGIHFRYAPSEDSLYALGTLVAVLTLVIPVAMVLSLMCTEEQGFGEFKDKLKKGALERGYFVVTILYRMGIGLYLSSSNQDDLSTLIVLALSLIFLLYNLVNLPFTRAYHNYRANICHLSQFAILFILMYYRSMSSATTQVYNYDPVYFEYLCLLVTLVVSMLVLLYEIYLFVRECQSKKEEEESEKEGNRLTVQKVSNNATMQNIAVFDDSYSKGVWDQPEERKKPNDASKLNLQSNDTIPVDKDRSQSPINSEQGQSESTENNFYKRKGSLALTENYRRKKNILLRENERKKSDDVVIISDLSESND